VWPERKLEGGDEKIAHKKKNMMMEAAGEAHLHRRVYTQKLLRTETFTHRGFYIEKFLNTERLLDTEAFTHIGWNVISPHFIPGTVSIGAAQSFCKGCISSLPPSQTMTEQKPVRHVFCDCFDRSSLPF
jgi:hypothetical protein